MYKTFLKAPFPYLGSKRKELKIIQQHLPENFEKFVDVFGGGGSVSLFAASNKNIQVYYNDGQKSLADFFTILLDEDKTDQFIDEFDEMEKSKETFKNMVKDKTYLTDPKMLFFRQRYSFKSIGTLYNDRAEINMPAYLDYLRRYSKIKNLHVTNEDFMITMERYKDDPTAFLYLDPPYIEKAVQLYDKKFNVADIDYILLYFKTCQCKIMLHIIYSPYIREKFGEYVKVFYPISYSSNDAETSKKYFSRYHIILCNY